MIRGAILKSIMRYQSRRIDGSRYQILRKRMESGLSDWLFKPPKDCAVTEVDAGGVPAEQIEWRGCGSDRLILYFHGGGYTIGSPRSHRDLVRRIARASNARALSVDYRLAPENPYPAARDDAMTAYRWLLDSGVRPERIALMGDSAGGGLTLVLAHDLRDRKIPMPACAVCLSPFADLTCSGASIDENESRDPLLYRKVLEGSAGLYAPGLDLSMPSVSPLFGDFSGMPPLLIHVGSDEVLLDDARRVAEKALNQGVAARLEIWPRMIHVFQAYTYYFPDAQRAIDEIGIFVRKHIQ